MLIDMVSRTIISEHAFGADYELARGSRQSAAPIPKVVAITLDWNHWRGEQSVRDFEKRHQRIVRIQHRYHRDRLR
jgi:hypothetical protein